MHRLIKIAHMIDIRNKTDIQCFVDGFYGDIRADNLIGPIFASRISEDDWPQHLDKMYRFWNTILFGSSEYRGNPFSHHIGLGIDSVHFDRWITLFHKNIELYFKGDKADEAKERAVKMRLLFESKLEYIKANNTIRPIL